MTVFFTFFFIITVLLIILFVYAIGGNVSTSGAEFIAKGREAGLTSSDIKLLKKVADELKLEKPLTLLGSISHVDEAINEINEKLKQSDYKNFELIDLLEELHIYRKEIELEKMERRSSITSSRQIDVDQHVKITVGNLEKYIKGVIVENQQNNLVIEIKGETAVKPGINWNGPINVFFWKKNDAGYYFETVVGQVKNKKWKVSHSDNLIRSQKRKDIRVNFDSGAYVYPLENISKKNSRSEGFTGTFVQLKNISEGGLAFYISGKMEPDSALKVEFKLNDKDIVVCGEIIDTTYNKSNNVSYVRIKTAEPDFEMLSVIREFLFTNNIEITGKDVEKKEEINNNNNNDEEDITEVEYLPDTAV